MGDQKAYQLPAVNPAGLEEHTGTFYPDSVKGPSEVRIKKRLGDAAGLTKFGVNLTTLPPDSTSALRHWHEEEDEFIYVLEGEVTLVSDAGEQILMSGMAAGFPAGHPDGHMYCNRSDKPAVVLEVGNRVAKDRVHYPEDDLSLVKEPGNHQFFNKAGEKLGTRVANSPRAVEDE